VVVNSKEFHNVTEFKRGHRAVIDAIKHEFVTGILYTVFITGFILGFITGIVTELKGAMFYGGLIGAFGGAFATPIHSIMRDNEETEFDIDSVRLFALKLLAFILASGVLGVSGNTSIGAAMGAIGAAFVGSLIAGALSRKAIKSMIANATIFAISLGALVGTAITAIGGTVPGTISGAITAGAVAITFDNLEATFRTALATGMFSGTVKTVAGVIMTIPREDVYAIAVAPIIGAILNNYYNNNIIMLGNGSVFGAAVAGTAFYIKHPNITNPKRILYSIMIFLIAFYARVINSVFSIGITGAMGGLVFAAVISRAFIHPPNNPFKYRTIFAAIAASCAAAGVISFFLFVYIIRLFTHSIDFPAPVGRTVLVATIGAAIGGFLLVAVENMGGLRLEIVDGVVTRPNYQLIVLIKRRFNVSSTTTIIIIFLGTVGFFVSSIILFLEFIMRAKLTGVTIGAIFGATTAIASGAITTVAMAIIKNISAPVITKMCTTQEIKTIIIITTLSAFIGGICGGYFTSSIVAGILISIAFPVVTMVTYTAPLYAERRHRYKRLNWVPLVRVMNRFGIELRNLTSEETQDNWIRYKIAKVQ
jgi:hypothetical protein